MSATPVPQPAPTQTQLEAVLQAALYLLGARQDRMLTIEEWDALEHAVAECSEPAANERTESLTVDAAKALVRSVVPMNGEPYQHRCPYDSFEAVAYTSARAIGEESPARWNAPHPL